MAAFDNRRDPELSTSAAAPAEPRPPGTNAGHNQQESLHEATETTKMEAEKQVPAKPITKRDCNTQTDLHPVEMNIDKSYEWNEWELRLKALQLDDLRSKVTHSMQTDESHMRRENASQTWLPKYAACQTKRDASTNTPKPQIYYAGLRGQRNADFVQIDLTRSVNE